MPSSHGRHRRRLAARRPSRLALGTAGGTGAVALAVAIVTVAAGPAGNGDPTHRDALAAPPASAPTGPAPATSSGPPAVGVSAAGAAAPVPTFAAARRTALPVSPGTAPPRISPRPTPTSTQPGQRRGIGHRPPTPSPTSTTEGTTSELLPTPVPTLP